MKNQSKFTARVEGMDTGDHSSKYLVSAGDWGHSRLFAASTMGLDTYLLERPTGSQADAIYPAIIVLCTIYQYDMDHWQVDDELRPKFAKIVGMLGEGIPYTGIREYPNTIAVAADPNLRVVTGWDESDEIFNYFVDVVEEIIEYYTLMPDELLSTLFGSTKAEYIGLDVMLFLYDAYKPGVGNSWVWFEPPYEKEFGIKEGFTGAESEYELRFLFSTVSDPISPPPEEGELMRPCDTLLSECSEHCDEQGRVRCDTCDMLYEECMRGREDLREMPLP